MSALSFDRTYLGVASARPAQQHAAHVVDHELRLRMTRTIERNRARGYAHLESRIEHDEVDGFAYAIGRMRFAPPRAA